MNPSEPMCPPSVYGLRCIHSTSLVRTVCTLMVVVAMGSGCTRTARTPINIDPGGSRPVTASLREGSRVRVTLKNGQQLRFVVDRVEPDFLRARDSQKSRYYFRDMAELQVEQRQFSVRKTAILVITTLAVIWLIGSFQVVVPA